MTLHETPAVARLAKGLIYPSLKRSVNESTTNFKLAHNQPTWLFGSTGHKSVRLIVRPNCLTELICRKEKIQHLMNCQICDGAMRRLFHVNGYYIRACESCAHQTAELTSVANHVAKVYDDAYFFGGGAGYTDYLAESELLINHGRRYAKLLSRYTKPGSMLDVGAAGGFLLKGFVDAGWEGRGIEPNTRMADHARTQLGMRVDVGSLENLECEERYDLITMIQVIAHFVDVGRAFEVASKHLAPSGFVLVESWDRESWTARIFGKRWHEYSPPSVVHWFSRGGLKRLGARHGLKAIAAGRPTKWLNGAHARSLLQYKLGTSRLGRIVYSLTRLIPSGLPIPYPSEDLFWVLFRKG